MKILKLSPYYYPEQISSSHLTNDLEEALINDGFEIEIYTPMPSRGITKEIHNTYKKIKYEEKYDGKIKIHRFSMFREGRNPIIRAVRYILCNILQYIEGVCAKDVDLIMAGSTPPTQGILVSMVKKKLKVPVIYNLQDIFPDSLVSTGLTKKGSLLCKVGHIIEKYTYENSDKIVVISEDFKENIMAKGVYEDKIEVIYNWVDENEVVPIERYENPIFDELKLDRSLFYVVYAGNLGYAQNIEVIIETAKKIMNYTDIMFIIFGGGSQENYYKNMVDSLDIKNVRLYPLQPYDKVSQVYSLGDISIVSCKPGLGSSAMPSKTWSIMSAATAIVANFDSRTDLQHIIEENNLGIFTDAGDIDALQDAILKLYKNKDMCQEMGRNGRKFILNNLTKKIGTRKYIDVINSIEVNKDV